MTDKFWVLWREGGTAPLMQYDNKNSAVKAALFMADQQKHTYFVLESVGRVAYTPLSQEYIPVTEKGKP